MWIWPVHEALLLSDGVHLPIQQGVDDQRGAYREQAQVRVAQAVTK